MPPSNLVSTVLAFAEPQRGLVARAQLRAAGLSSDVITKLVSEGWLREIRPRVYGVAGRAISTWDDAVAVGLLAGPGSALSHSTAAAIHRFPDVVPTDQPEITVEKSRHPRLAGAKVHRVAVLPACDVQQRSGVGVTTAARTLVDLAGRLEAELLGRIIDEGSIAQQWTIDELAGCASRLAGQGRAGGRTLRRVLTERIGEPTARSALELRMIRILAPFAPFKTQCQVILDGEIFVLDIAWPWWRVAAEVDGWWSRRQSRSKLDRDSHKANVLLAHHWQVVHLTSSMSAATVLRDVGRLLPGGDISSKLG
jgi:hypothetical protein